MPLVSSCRAEVELTLSVDHVNVVRIWGFTTQPSLCMVLELMGRGSVYDLIHDEAAPLRYVEQQEGLVLQVSAKHSPVTRRRCTVC